MCRHFNTARHGGGDHAGKNWCERVLAHVFALAQPDCPEWQARICGDCVVFNGSKASGVGGCSRLGARFYEQQACRAWFPKAELNAPLYGKKA